jgi:phosphonate transport system substrate-binding protein
MMSRLTLFPRFFVASVVFLSVAVLSNATAPVRAGESPVVKTLTLGMVSETHRKEIEEHFHEFVRYLARRLNGGAEIDARVVTAPTPFELARLLDQRRVDFYMESAYPTYIINFVHGSGRLLLRRWKSGLADYHSVIFTRRNSGLRRIEDLKGRTIVFEDAGSTSGYLLPKLYLSRQGLKLVEKKSFDPNTLPGDVAYFFAYSREKLLNAVATGRADAGAFSSDDFGSLEEKKRLEIAVLAQTERLPRHLLSVRADLAPAVAASLEAILLRMHEDPDGRRILQMTDNTTKFDPLPGGEATMRRRLLESFYSPDGR